MPRWRWCFVALTLEARRGVGQLPALARSGRGTGARHAPGVGRWRTRSPTTRDALVLAASADGDRRTRHFDGRLDRPRLIGRALDDDALPDLAAAPDDLDAVAADLIGAWDFSLDIPSDRITDVSGHERHGTTANLPTRAVTGHDFSGDETDWRRRPGEYGAIHFHRDDLEDAGWDADFELTIPADLPSGIYAAWLQAGDDEDYLPVHGPSAARDQPVADRRADVDRDLRDVRQLHRHRSGRLARGRAAG